MSYEHISKIIEVNSPQEVNEYTKEGWVLLFHAQYWSQDEGIAYPVYTLGWPRHNDI